jgi:hypothetical protein
MNGAPRARSSALNLNLNPHRTAVNMIADDDVAYKIACRIPRFVVTHMSLLNQMVL